MYQRATFVNDFCLSRRRYRRQLLYPVRQCFVIDFCALLEQLECMPKPSAARRKLSAAVHQAGGVTAAAHQLGVSPSTVSYLLDGKRNPGLELAFRIRELFGIRLEAWRDDQKPLRQR